MDDGTDELRHACPVAGCQVDDLKRHQPLCTPHWDLVPAEVKKCQHESWNGGSPDRIYHEILGIVVRGVNRKIGASPR